MNYTSSYRINIIHDEIKKNTYPDVNKLAEKLESSIRTIYRDIAFLRDSIGAPLEYHKQKGGYYYTEPTWELPGIIFTEQELLALLVAKHAVLHYTGVPYGKHLNEAFRKIMERLPSEKIPNTMEIEDNISFRFGACREFDPEILDTVAKALKNKKQIKIRYYSAGSDKETVRTVEPYHLDNLRGDWYLIGLCRLRNDIRIFCINRIKECSLLKSSFTIDPNFSYQDIISESFGILMSDEPVEIVMRFWNLEARLARERKWHPQQVIEELNDGSILIKLKVKCLEEVKRIILSCGKDVEVIEPAFLREEIVKELKGSLERYQSNNPAIQNIC